MKKKRKKRGLKAEKLQRRRSAARRSREAATEEFESSEIFRHKMGLEDTDRPLDPKKSKESSPHGGGKSRHPWAKQDRSSQESPPSSGTPTSGTGKGFGRGPQAFLARIASQRRDGGDGDTSGTGSPSGGWQGKDRRAGADRRGGGDRRKSFRARDEEGMRSDRGGRAHRDSTYDKANRLPKVDGEQQKALTKSGIDLVVGDIQKNKKGFAFLLCEPEDLYIPEGLADGLVSGDKVKAWVNRRRNEVLKIEVIQRGIRLFIGTLLGEGSRRVAELRDKTMLEYVQLERSPEFSKVPEGHKVMVEILEYEPQLKGKILRDFGPKLEPQFDTLAVIARGQWPQEFSPEAVEEASTRSLSIIQSATEQVGKSGARRDLRDKAFVTIDGKDSRDFDDAIYVEKTRAGFVLYVAIADVAEFVVQDSPLDKEAYARATSVYFPDFVVPMLPEALSNDACSLKPNEDRLTLVSEIHYDQNAKKKSSKVYEAIIHSKRRCIYEDVQKEFEAGDSFWTVPFELYKLIKLSRQQRGSLDLDLPEAKLVLNEKSETIDIIKADRKDSHRLIEEFMIAANESVTELMEREGWPFVYRIHEPPAGESFEKFQRFALALGLKVDFSKDPSPKKLARFLKSIEEHPLAQVLSYLMLRSLKQAKYSTENLKHFGLASDAYTHFTSPIRRYPDLVVHRILKRYVRRQNWGKGEDSLEAFKDYLLAACDHCSKQERRADQLEGTVEKVKKARFMGQHLGENFTAKITNVSGAGIFVELEKWFVEGLVPMDEVGDDYYEFNEEKLILFGRRSGHKYKLGDKIEVTVLRVDEEQGFVDFSLVKA